MSAVWTVSFYAVIASMAYAMYVAIREYDNMRRGDDRD